ncbi:hypothetical protein F4780DRAFT_482952 [Xylariomycetidae sp. FL0641]|nr:hypothetical protein F4780DRAFT_482952 [Xylariomycetidae sp. FL0641]
MSSIQANLNPPSLPPSTPSEDSSSSSQSRSGKAGVVVPNPARTENPSTAADILLSAAKDVRQIVRLIQCPVCSVVLEEPTTLPCGYSICKTCIPRTHLRTNISWPADASRQQGFECPMPHCPKEHALADCAIDVILKKAITSIRTSIERDRALNEDAHVSTQVTIQNRREVAGLSSLEEKEPESLVEKGGRLVATYTMATSGKLDYSCEVSYTSVGASNEVVENLDTTIFTRLKECTRPEMDCQVCYALFLDPMTTTCGHTFCRNCLHRILDHSNLCPICRRSLSIQARVDSRSFPSNDRLCKMINGFWADLVALRAQAYRLEQQANYGGFDIPLFVCTLSFPRMPLFLHVFEPRYRLMIRRAMESDRTFGMVYANEYARSGEPHFMELGTLLRIVNIEFFPDGRSLIETVGLSRFRVTRHGWLDGYVVGNIEKIDDISVAEEEAIEAAETSQARNSGISALESPATHEAPSQPTATAGSPPPVPISLEELDTMSTQQLVQLGISFVTRMRARSVAWLTARVLAIYGECPSDPAIFPWWFASILPVREEEKYRLLGTSSVRQRLKICCRWIVEWESSRWTLSDCSVL